MKDEEINIAIAEALGWCVENYGPQGHETLYWRLRKPCGKIRADGCTGEKWSKAVFSKMVPNYCNDLNAMHEAEKTLPRDQWKSYLDWLDVTCGGELCVSDMLEDADLIYVLVNATASQRAEAFLRTIGKWQEPATHPNTR